MLFLLRMLPVYIKDRNIEVQRFFKAHFTTHREYSVQSSSYIRQWQKTICFSKMLRAPFSVSEAVMSLP